MDAVEDAEAVRTDVQLIHSLPSGWQAGHHRVVFIISRILHAVVLLVMSFSNLSLFSFLLFPSACADPFTSTEAVDDSIPNLNPFLTKPVDAVHLPVVSSDGVSFSSRTPSHEMFGGKKIYYFI